MRSAGTPRSPQQPVRDVLDHPAAPEARQAPGDREVGLHLHRVAPPSALIVLTIVALADPWPRLSWPFARIIDAVRRLVDLLHRQLAAVGRGRRPEPHLKVPR